MGEYRNLDDIRDVVLANGAAGKIYLKDVAQVEDAHEEVRVITRLGGNSTVKLSVFKQADANTVEVARGVKRRIEQLQPSLPPGIKMGMVENQADYVIAALNGVRNAAIEASILVIVIIYLFLGSWRHVLVMLLALPITLILNFGLMKLMGFSLNIFSLGGLVVAIGVVLDNSIVVLENITRLQHLNPDQPPEEVAEIGTAEVGPAILAATLSFLALFVPFLLVPGLISLLFRELILVIAGIVCVSLLVAITLTPLLTAVLTGKRAESHEDGPLRPVLRLGDRWYGRLLELALRHRLAVIGTFCLPAGGRRSLVPLSWAASFCPAWMTAGSW